MALQCKKCGAPLGRDSIDRKRRTARCSACGASFRLKAGRRKAGALDKHASVEAREEGDRLVLSMSWRTRRRIHYVILILLFGPPALLCICAKYLTRFGPEYTLPDIILPTYAILLPVLAILSIVLFTSKVVVIVSPRGIRVHDRKWIWPRRKWVDAEDVTQVFGVKQKHKVETRDCHKMSFFRYNLYSRNQYGDRVLLVSQLEIRSQALFLEQAIEKHLGIQDRRVRGEFKNDVSRRRPR